MTRFEASYHYRRGIKAAIDRYHGSVGVIWRHHGRPADVPNAIACKHEMQAAWRRLVSTFQIESAWLDLHS